MSSPDSRPGGPVSVQARVLENRPAGAYRHLVLAADGIAAVARPGHFITTAVGGPTSGMLLRRAFSIHRVTRGDEGEPDTVEIVVAAHAPGTNWLTGRREGDQVSVVGPLGRAFPLPAEPVACVLVGGGYGSAPLFWLAETLQQRGCRVDLVLGAATEAKLFGVKLAKYVADAMVMTTEDGSAGIEGRITDVLPEVVSGSRAAVIYACGPMGLLQAVATIAAEHRAVAQVAVEEAMACGIGVCMTCVLPVRDPMGQTKMVRACVEGPVFRGERIRWDAFEDGWGRVPPDCLGAAGMAAYTVASDDATHDVDLEEENRGDETHDHHHGDRAANEADHAPSEPSEAAADRPIGQLSVAEPPINGADPAAPDRKPQAGLS